MANARTKEKTSYAPKEEKKYNTNSKKSMKTEGDTKKPKGSEEDEDSQESDLGDLASSVSSAASSVTSGIKSATSDVSSVDPTGKNVSQLVDEYSNQSKERMQQLKSLAQSGISIVKVLPSAGKTLISFASDPNRSKTLDQVSTNDDFDYSSNVDENKFFNFDVEQFANSFDNSVKQTSGAEKPQQSSAKDDVEAKRSWQAEQAAAIVKTGDKDTSFDYGK